ncbi:hypothetical protein PIB30_002395 [Stylosanthes scabra]|uniref:Uncharacterized protein n=1 Tax=Stylosanthes scabra TaxID=79078 RepID=A0ABU6V518_9FABA|nr:hypothetical protein [Stylosanthes scabra]
MMMTMMMMLMIISMQFIGKMGGRHTLASADNVTGYSIISSLSTGIGVGANVYVCWRAGTMVIDSYSAAKTEWEVQALRSEELIGRGEENNNNNNEGSVLLS